MIEEFIEGDVVICPTGQAGTLIQLGEQCCVLLANNDLWYGNEKRMRRPQGPEDLAACPLNVDRFIGR